MVSSFLEPLGKSSGTFLGLHLRLVVAAVKLPSFALISITTLACPPWREPARATSDPTRPDHHTRGQSSYLQPTTWFHFSNISNVTCMLRCIRGQDNSNVSHGLDDVALPQRSCWGRAGGGGIAVSHGCTIYSPWARGLKSVVVLWMLCRNYHIPHTQYSSRHFRFIGITWRAHSGGCPCQFKQRDSAMKACNNVRA